jgi:hypothetical protein
MLQIYDESACRSRILNPNNSISNKNKKVKRGAKTSYGNYSQTPVHNPFVVGNKFKLHKARKSLVTQGGQKNNILMSNSHIFDSFK